MGCQASKAQVKQPFSYDPNLKPGERPINPSIVELVNQYSNRNKEIYNNPMASGKEPDTEKVVEAIKHLKGFKYPVVNETFELLLSSRRKEDCLLVKELKGYKWPNYRKLSLKGAVEIHSDILYEFFSLSAPDSLQTMHLEFDGNINNVCPSLCNTITSVTDTVILSNLTMDTKWLRMIFESCSGCRTLIFHHCTFTNLDDLFEIDSTRKYLLSEIWFYRCFDDNITQLEYLIKALSETKLKNKKLKLMLSSFDFVESPWKAYTNKLVPLKSTLATEYVKDAKYSQTKYTGGWMDDQPHGFGTLSYRNGTIREAMMSYGTINGFAISHESDGTIKRGYWHLDTPHGLWVELDQFYAPKSHWLCENGKIITTFTQEEAKLIEEGNLDWTQFFTNEQSISKMYPDQTFEIPEEFNVLKLEVDFRITYLNTELRPKKNIIDSFLGNKQLHIMKRGQLPNEFYTEAGNEYMQKMKKSFRVTDIIAESSGILLMNQ